MDVEVLVADVLVTTLYKFQQSVPQIQFLGRVLLDIPIVPQRQVLTAPNCAKNGRLHRCSPWERLLTRPLTFQRQGQSRQCRKLFEGRSNDRQRQVPAVRDKPCGKPSIFRRCSF